MKQLRSTSALPHPSPFFRRSYGGFTAGQIQFYSNCIDLSKPKTIADPMGGQGVALAQLAWAGHNVWLGDINPALSFLAALRDPAVMMNHKDLATELRSKLSIIQRRRRSVRKLEFVDDWFPPSIRDDLRDFGAMVSLPLFDDPFAFDTKFWNMPVQSQFEIGIILLSARSIACTRSTDNPTWARPGGLARETRIAPAVRRTLDVYEEYVLRNIDRLSIKQIGKITVRRTNVAKAAIAEFPMANAIITSPPYANRLDYTKLWAPETEALGVMCNRSTGEIRKDQIGSTVMKGRLAEIEANPRPLPEVAERALRRIQKDKAASSGNYYYPFFRSYAEDLTAGLLTTAGRVRKRGIMVVFVRDTVRKDILFPTGQIVTDVLKGQCGFDLVSEHQEIIKGHVGQLRQQASSGLFGLAQQEWWLAFQRPS
jgi:hypothetical protein